MTQADIELIVDKFMGEVSERMSELNVSLRLSSTARAWLAKSGFDRMYGARPLKRSIQKYVESPLSKKLLSGEFEEGSTIVIDEKDGEIFFTVDVSSDSVKKAPSNKKAKHLENKSVVSKN